MQTLKMAKGKYAGSKESLDQFKPADKQVLLPLTGSMYVPGHIKDASNVIVEIGTGYYMELVNFVSNISCCS